MTRLEYKHRLEALVKKAPDGFKVIAVVGDLEAEDLSLFCSCCHICAEGLLTSGLAVVEEERDLEPLAVWQ